MKIHVLERRQRIELPIAEAFELYADARNLERITPPWLGFEVATPGEIEMREGTLIEYRLKLHGVPIRWRTRIEVWEPPQHFVDVQVSGPYALWHHTHGFEADCPGAVWIGDRVRYSVPFWPSASSPTCCSSVATSSASLLTAARRSPASSRPGRAAARRSRPGSRKRR